MGVVYRRGRAAATLLSCVVALAACGDRGSPPATPESAPHANVSRNGAASEGPLVVFLGDSLTAGYGLAESEAFPALVASGLRAKGPPVRVVNAGVSGDTSAGGLARLEWVLTQNPDVLVVGLGANDALRGQPLGGVEENLRGIVAGARGAGVRVLLLGQRIPTNYGPDYAEAFAALYPRVAREAGATLVPFLLEGVGGRPSLNMPDGIHPNARGHAIIAGNVTPYVEKLLKDLDRR